MSRLKKTKYNAVINIGFFSVNILIAFFSRKIFIDNLGIPFIGVNATIQSIIGFLNLSELGVTTAIAVVLYKPLLDNNADAICEIITLLRRYYMRIGNIILLAGIFVSFLFPLIFSKVGVSLVWIYIGYYAYLTSSLIGYYNNYRQVLLTSDQRNYEIVKVYNLFFILKTIFQIVIAIYFKSILIWFLMEYVFGILYTIALNNRITKVYPWLKRSNSNAKELTIKYPRIKGLIKNLFIHKISGFVAQQSSQLIIFGILNVTTVAYYNNYMLIVSKAQGFISNLLGISMTASVGNLVAEGERKKILSVFWELYALRFLFGGIIAFLVLSYITPFINVWLGEYSLDRISVIIIVINLFILIIRTTVDDFISAYGLFKDIWAPIAETIFNITFSICFGIFFGLPGVLAAPVISMLIFVLGWKPFYLFRCGFNSEVRFYYMSFIKYVAIILISIYLTRLLVIFTGNTTTSFKAILLSASLSLVIYVSIYSFLMFIFAKEYKRLFFRLIYMFDRSNK